MILTMASKLCDSAGLPHVARKTGLDLWLKSSDDFMWGNVVWIPFFQMVSEFMKGIYSLRLFLFDIKK